MVRWCEGGVNQGLLPMIISEEENNLFCACHLLNCEKAKGNHRLLEHRKWCKTEKKKKVNPAGYRTRVAFFSFFF
jgi:hypothetical protein